MKPIKNTVILKLAQICEQAEKSTPGQAFLARRVRSGDDIILASCRLMHSDIPLDTLDRLFLGTIMRFLYAGALVQRRLPRTQRKFLNTFMASMREIQRAELRKENIRGKKAEDILRAREGDISLAALRQRTTRSRRLLKLQKR